MAGMNRISVWMAVAVALFSMGCRRTELVQAPEPEVLFVWHFVGTKQLAADTNALWFNRIANLEASAEFKDELTRKLARAPFQLFKHRLSGGAPDYADLIKPLWDDLIGAESVAELRAATNHPAEFVLAVGAPKDRAALWQSNLAVVLRAWTACEPEHLSGQETAGWLLRKHHAPNLIRLERIGNWVLLGFGHDKLVLFDKYAQSIRKSGRPAPSVVGTDSQAVLECFIDWPKAQTRLEGQLGLELPIRLPAIRLSVTSAGEQVLSRADLEFPEPLGWSAEPWCIPTNTIREPLISFTAARGVAPLLRKLKLVNELELEPVPNQLYLWGLQDIPFQTFLAVPAADTTNFIKRLDAFLKQRLVPKLQQKALGSIEPDSESGAGLIWRGLPFIGPYIVPVTEPTGNFLLLGLFPNSPVTNPPPPELYAQFFNRNEIAYYDWEITHVRFHQLWNLCQLTRLIANLPQLNTESGTWKWLSSVSTNLGNTATHITVDNPKKMTVVRRSQLGLTALELVGFANWFESDEFPLWHLGLEARHTPATSDTNLPETDAEAGRQH